MKLLRNKIVIGTLCILVGLLVGFVALPAYQSHSQSVTVHAVRMKAPAQVGAQITAGMLEVVSVPDKLIAGSISDTVAVVGCYAATDLYIGDYLTAAKITATLEEQSPFSAGAKSGKLIVSVSLPSLAAGVSGRLQSGDVVTVMAYPKTPTNQSMGLEPDSVSQPTSDVTIDPELRYLEVCMVTAGDGADADVKADPGKDDKNALPATVSFFATESQALKLAELEQDSVIHLAFIARGEAGTQYIPDLVQIDTEVK